MRGPLSIPVTTRGFFLLGDVQTGSVADAVSCPGVPWCSTLMVNQRAKQKYPFLLYLLPTLKEHEAKPPFSNMHEQKDDFITASTSHPFVSYATDARDSVKDSPNLRLPLTTLP